MISNSDIDKASPTRGNQGIAGLSLSAWQFKYTFAPPVTGALGAIGQCDRTSKNEGML